MASTHKSLRSGTANKRPTTSIADGQIALNTNTTSPGLFFKDSTGATIIKVGPVHVGTTAPNASPAAGGSSGNSTGEVWLDTSLTPNGVKIWNGASWTNATPIGSTTVQGLLELATNAETQTGTDPDRAVTPAGLQSKVSDSTSTTSSTTIASSTAVKSAYDLANAALPKSGGTVTGNLEIGTTGSLSFEGATADAFETTIAVVDPTADRTITLPDTTGTVVTTGDTGTVTSTMIADGTIVDADISASAEIAVSKLADGAARQLLQTDAAGTGVEWASNIDIPGTLDVTSAATFDSSVAVTGALTKSGNNVVTVGDSGTVTSTMIADGTIVNGDINASAAIAGTKVSPDFGSQTITTTGVVSAALGAAATPSLTFTGDLNTGIYSPGADQVAISTGGSGRLFVESNGNIRIGTASSTQSLLHLSASALVDLRFADTGEAADQKNWVWQTGTGVGTGTFRLRATNDANSTGENAYLITRSGTSIQTHQWLTSGSERLRITSTGALNFTGAGTAGSTQAVSFNGSAPINSLVIDSSGRLGVGTSSPDNKLSVGIASADEGVELKATYNGARVARFGLVNPGVDNTPYIGSVTGNDFGFITSNTRRMTLDASGRLGIGTSSPGVVLDVRGDSGVQFSPTTNNTNAQLELTARNGSGASAISRLSSISEDPGTGASSFAISTRKGATGIVTEALRIDSAQRVGIGTTSPGTYNARLALYGSTADETRIALFQNGVVGTSICANGGLVFGVDGSTGGTERARIDNSGRLLVGTSTAPTVGVPASATFVVQGYAGVPTGDSLISLQRGQAPASISSGSQLGAITFGANDGSPYAQIHAATDAAGGTNDYPGRLVFSTTADGASSPTERMRITNGGFLKASSTGGYGNATGGYHEIRQGGGGNEIIVMAHTASSGPYGINLAFTGASPNDTTSYFLYCGDSTAQRATIRSNGGLANYSANNANLSDRNAKKDISPAAGTWNCIKEWEIVNYRYKDQPDDADLNLGVIAQQVAESCPEVITVFSEAKDAKPAVLDDEGNEVEPAQEAQPEKLGIKEQQMYWMAIKALQEAQVRIEQLEATNSDLLARVSALESA